MAGLLALVLVTGVLQIVPLPAPPAAAAVTRTAMTWNLHGNGGNSEKALDLMADHEVTVAALQEVANGDFMGLPHSDFNAPHVKPDGTASSPYSQWKVEKYTLSDYDMTAFVINTDSHNRRIAIVTSEDVATTDVHVLDVRPDYLGRRFPALGVKIDDVWYYSIHASTQRHRADNNADTVVHDISELQATSAFGGDWAAMGDWNRFPSEDSRAYQIQLGQLRASARNRFPDEEAPLGNVLDLDDDERLIWQGARTHDHGAELDYMVAKGAGDGYKAMRYRTTNGSDHYPVFFAEETDEDTCMGGTTPALNAPRPAAAGACPLDDLPRAIVSMGDSYISGEGGRWQGNANTSDGGDSWGTDRAADGTEVYEKNADGGDACHRSDVAEIKNADIAGLPPERKFNIACSGAETEHLLTEKFKSEKPQIEQLADIAEKHQVHTIVVSIGGNDLKFSSIVETCAKNFLFARGPCNEKADETLKEGVGDVRRSVSKVLTAIRDTMSEAGQAANSYNLVLQSYPSPLPPVEEIRYPGDHYNRYTSGGCPFYDDDLTWTRDGVIRRIRDMLQGVAADAGAAFLDLTDAFAGHELCAKTVRQAEPGEKLTLPAPAPQVEWVRFIQGYTTPGDWAEPIHPNAHGQRALSACLTETVYGLGMTDRMVYPCVGRPKSWPGETAPLRSPIDDAVETADGWRGDGFRLADHYLFQRGKYARFNPDADIDGEIHPGKIEFGRSDGWLGQVKDTPSNWPSLRDTDFAGGVDAVFEARTDSAPQRIFIRGDQYMRVELDPETADDTRIKGPGPLTDYFHVFRDTAFQFGVDAAAGDQKNRALVFRHDQVGVVQVTIDRNDDEWLVPPTRIDEAFPVLKNTPFAKRVDAALIRHQRESAMWVDLISGTQVVTILVTLDDLPQSTLKTSPVELTVMWPGLRGSIFDWSGKGTRPDRRDLKMAAGAPFDKGSDDRESKPSVSGPHSRCRPEGLAATRGVDAPYCEVYDKDGREWLGGDGHDRRVVGYFTGWRTGENDQPRYLASNIPWSKVTHVNYAFAKVEDNEISIGDPDDPDNPATGLTWTDSLGGQPDASLPYKGHFNLLARYKNKHPQVKVLISVGGWADTRNFYTMATNADGSVNQGGIDTFADSVVDFLDRYKAAFDGVDIDYEYPSALPSAGNPADRDLSEPRRKGLQKGYNALMKTLREKLDRAGADRGRYYLLTAAASASGYLVRGYDAGEALRYLDFVNLMTYDMHGSWNHFVGPQAPLYDDGKDNELVAAKFYSTKEYDKTGYFNVDWAYHYYRGALPPGRINIGIPYYTRGWQNVSGGTDGLWGTAALPDQGKCQPGTGPGSGASTPVACGNGAQGIDNIWHDLGNLGQEIASGSNPMWHARNLQEGVAPSYLRAYTDVGADAGGLKGSYEEKYDDTLQASWLWNQEKKVFLSTENDASIDAKIEYVKDNKLGGVMMWELAGDYAQDEDGEYGMGYDLTDRLDEGLRGSGGYQTTRQGETTLPGDVVDVTAELVDYPTQKDPNSKDDPFYPMRPTLRITNDTDVTLTAGTEISFDIPTATPPLLTDENYQKFGKNLTVEEGRSGANVGGLGADFHRVTMKLDYCGDLAPGAKRDIILRHYLPLTGPANVTLKSGSRTYGITRNDQSDTTVVSPDLADGIACQAEEWRPHPYNPHGTFAFEKDGKNWRIVDWVGSLVLDHPATWDTPHLVENQPGNQNQLWTVDEEGGSGWYRIKSRGKCLQADGVLKSLSVHDCDDEPHQWWQIRVMKADGNDVVVTGPPTPGTGYQLVSYDSEEYDEPAYVAEGKNSGNTPGTQVVAGDPDGSTASTVIRNGSYWRANWWTNATDEPGRSDAWKKLGPVSSAALPRTPDAGADGPRHTPSPSTATVSPPPGVPTGPRTGNPPSPNMKPALPAPKTHKTPKGR
ncbi:hypothetical protein Ssi03_61540 [Sphaerisporangium siamense]|uniref:GH18 family chitinase n=1 Tax=Sphaerisporangium siamense TaxID=795645 RepID=A0A7W7D908_9ACTN|nr:glycosyl hydrolase family 18 protein [Sphaerisporangium siamense]MBB4702467.1 GH18 family chitinase [Sphaerisporangium siamense]GII88164.1 hypothetical protein Ssi03_61540 [Sphaerisporangium siamense]